MPPEKILRMPLKIMILLSYKYNSATCTNILRKRLFQLKEIFLCYMLTVKDKIFLISLKIFLRIFHVIFQNFSIIL